VLQIFLIFKIFPRGVNDLTDFELIDLYCSRSENAIAETANLYGAYCTAISMNILHNKEDTEECVNDTYLSVWNSIPPQRPGSFSSFIGRIARNLSLNRYKMRKTQKRTGEESALLFSELEGVIPAAQNVENQVDVKELADLIDRFLDLIAEDDMIFFVRRYWYGDSIAKIAGRFSVGQSRVKTNLHRTRSKLKKYLEREGITI